jgi:hypothetical protein
MYRGIIVLTCNSTVCKVLVTVVMVVTILGFTPHHSYYCHGLLYSGSLVDGILYLRIPLFWLDNFSITSPALLNDVG